MQRTRSFRNESSDTDASPDRYPITASEAQLILIDRLLNEREMDDREFKTFRLLREGEYCEFDKKVASGMIESLLKMPAKQNDDLKRVADELQRLNLEGRLNTFTASLHEQLERRGTLSEKQIAAVLKGMEKRAENTLGKTLPDVPAGRYAIESVTDGTIAFYKVDRPDSGRWEGYTFVKRLVASGGFGDDLSEQRLSFEVTRTILEQIIEQGIEKSMSRYGHELGVCGHCGRTLTDEVSIERGIGPVCASKMGW